MTTHHKDFLLKTKKRKKKTSKRTFHIKKNLTKENIMAFKE